MREVQFPLDQHAEDDPATVLAHPGPVLVSGPDRQIHRRRRDHGLDVSHLLPGRDPVVRLRRDRRGAASNGDRRQGEAPPERADI